MRLGAAIALGLGVLGGLLGGSAALVAAGVSRPLDGARIDRVFADLADPARPSPGCALGVSRDGLLVYERGYGFASLELRSPIGPGTVFELASASKQFMAATIVLLAEDGRLSLDDPLRKWLPELPAAVAPVTLRAMLHHESGLRDYVDLLGLDGFRTADWTTVDEALALLDRQRGLEFTPGTRFEYNDSNYFLLSIVAERAGGRPWRAIAAERLFGPLGMRHSEVLDDHARVVPGRATPYSFAPGGGFAVDASNWEQTGDGGVQSTVEDLALWHANLDAPRVGGERLAREMESRGRLDDGEMGDYGLGLKIDEYRGVRRVGHTGAWVGWRSVLARFPSEHTAMALLCNAGIADAVVRFDRVADVVLGDRLQGPATAPAVWPPTSAPAAPRSVSAPPAPPAPSAPPPPPPIDGAEHYAGDYYCPELDARWRLEARRGGLVLHHRAYHDPALVELEPDVFAAGPLRLDFERAAGERIAFTVALGNIHGLRCERVPMR